MTDLTETVAVTQADRDAFRDIFHVDPRDDCPHNSATLAKLARHRLAAVEDRDRLRKACDDLCEAISDADDAVFEARETLDNYANDEQDEATAIMAHDDANVLHTAWRRIKAARDILSASRDLDRGEGVS